MLIWSVITPKRICFIGLCIRWVHHAQDVSLAVALHIQDYAIPKKLYELNEIAIHT